MIDTLAPLDLITWAKPASLPNRFNVPSLDPLMVTGVLRHPSFATLSRVFAQLMALDPVLARRDPEFERFTFEMRPGDTLLRFERTESDGVHTGLALLRLPNQIVMQIVL